MALINTTLNPVSFGNAAAGLVGNLLGITPTAKKATQPVATQPVPKKSVSPTNQTINRTASPTVNYGQLENRGGTIYNKATGTGYATPEQLAKDLGINSTQIQWGNIANATPTSGLLKLPNQTNQTNQTAPVNQPTGLTTSTPQPTFTPNSNLAGQLTTGLANTAVGPNPVTTSATTSLMNKANQPTEDYTNAMKLAEDYNRQLQESRTNQANALAANAANPIPLEFQQGRGQILANQYLAQQNALAQGFAGAGSLLGAANTQQSLQQGAAQAAGGLGQAQQGLAQSGLGQAAGLAQPQLGQYGQAYYSPVTGQPIGGGGGALNPLNNISSLAQQVINGQISPSQAYAMGGNVSNFQGALNQEIQNQNPGFDTAKAEGTYAAKVQSGTITGTAGAQSFSDLTQQSSQLKAILGGADANFKLLIDTAQKGGVNDMNVPILNTLANNVKLGLTSDAAVINFRSTLAEVRSQYANIIGGGVSTDMSKEIASNQVPENISLAALQTLYTQMTSAAQNRIAGIDNQIKNIGTQTGTTSGGTSGGGGVTFGWNG